MSTSFTILWSPPLPDDQNGVIINYKLDFTELGTHYSSVFFTNATSYEVMMLDPFTSYAVSIAAATAIGFGPLSQHFPVQTAEDGMLASNYTEEVVLFKTEILLVEFSRLSNQDQRTNMSAFACTVHPPFIY